MPKPLARLARLHRPTSRSAEEIRSSLRSLISRYEAEVQAIVDADDRRLGPVQGRGFQAFRGVRAPDATSDLEWGHSWLVDATLPPMYLFKGQVCLGTGLFGSFPRGQERGCAQHVCWQSHGLYNNVWMPKVGFKESIYKMAANHEVVVIYQLDRPLRGIDSPHSEGQPSTTQGF